MKSLLIRNILIFGALIIALLVAGCSETTQEPGEAEVAPQTAGGGESAAPTHTPVPTLTPTPTPVLTPTSTPEADPRQELGYSAWGAVFEDGTQTTWFRTEIQTRSGKLCLVSKRYVLRSLMEFSLGYSLPCWPPASH